MTKNKLAIKFISDRLHISDAVVPERVGMLALHTFSKTDLRSVLVLIATNSSYWGDTFYEESTAPVIKELLTIKRVVRKN